MVLILLVGALVGRADMLDVDGFRKPCDYVCHHGACLYENCADASCPGGGCTFKNSHNPSCRGGACVFDRCAGAKCEGGRSVAERNMRTAPTHLIYPLNLPTCPSVNSCTFVNPPETLQHGYCDGENCNIDGKPHPTLSGYLSV